MSIGMGYFHPPPSTYSIPFYNDTITTTVTADPQTVSEWISEIESLYSSRRRTIIFGLDVEWRAPFSPIPNPVATLQLCIGRRCLIFQILHSPYIPISLINLLSNQDYTFVGVGVTKDLEKLREDHGIGFGAYALDLGSLAAEQSGNESLKNAGLKTLARIVIEKDVEKPRNVTLSKWDNHLLSYEQVEYACVDAFVSFEIGRILVSSYA